MEADWSVEIGRDLPRIAVPWTAEGACFIDLRSQPGAVALLQEARTYPALARALVDLNSSSSRVFTAKCDVWRVAAEDLDRLEMESTAEDTNMGLACYIDVVRREEAPFASFSQQEAWLRKTTETFRAIPGGCSRVELVLRRASLAGFDAKREAGFAVTLYVTGCGGNEQAAERNWETALTAVVPVLMGAP